MQRLPKLYGAESMEGCRTSGQSACQYLIVLPEWRPNSSVETCEPNENSSVSIGSNDQPFSCEGAGVAPVTSSATRLRRPQALVRPPSGSSRSFGCRERTDRHV